MRKTPLALLALLAFTATAAAQAEAMCEVTVCNKLERFSLSITSHIKDYVGETCFTTRLPESEAVKGKVLSSASRWYQGSFNPTKKSVTRIKSVGACRP